MSNLISLIASDLFDSCMNILFKKRKLRHYLNNRLTLQEYRDIVSTLARPTEDQIDDFIEFVCSAHSWYKPILLLKTKMPYYMKFIFYINPHAGMKLEYNWRVGYTARERLDTDEDKIHYTWMTTSEYRRRFGYLAYNNTIGTNYDKPLSDTDGSYPKVPFIEGKYGAIPDEIMEVCSSLASGIIHPHSANRSFENYWIDLYSETFPNSAKIQKLIEEIREYSRWREQEGQRVSGMSEEEKDKWYDEKFDSLSEVELHRYVERLNPKLEELLEPERFSQIDGMKKAIYCMLNLLYPNQ